MNARVVFLQSIFFILLTSVGGFLLSLIGLSIGWMLGTLILAAILAFRKPRFLSQTSKKGIPKYWLYAGQCILGIELGQKINLSVVTTFQSHWSTITIMLLLSVVFSLLSGYLLWKFSSTDLLTSFFGTTPGGMSAMPGMAEEVGANTAVVSIIQTMRVFLVVLAVPLFVVYWGSNTGRHAVSVTPSVFEWGSLLWTGVLIVTAVVGYYIGKKLKFPAPWLVGGMLTVAIVQTAASSYVGYNLQAYWPHSVMILSQIFIASSIGSRFHKEMFIGVKKIMVVALINTIGLIAAMFVCALFVSKITGIELITSILAFAPGGIAEMATTSIVLQADSTLVVAVQVLRILTIWLLLPPLFRMFHQWGERKRIHSHVS